MSSSGSPKNASAPCWSSSTILRSSTPAVADDKPADALELGLAVVAGEELQHRAQVVEIDEREAGAVGVVEHQRQRRRLRLVGAEHLGQQLGTERRHRGAHRHAGAEAAEGEERHRMAGSAPTRSRARSARASPCRWARPACSSPERSPLMSAAKTGTPIAESCSAISWSVFVFPGAGGAGDEAVAVAHARGDLHHRLGHDGAADDPAARARRRRPRSRTPRRCGVRTPPDPRWPRRRG